MARPGIEPWVSLIPEGRAKLLHYWALVGEESPTPTFSSSDSHSGSYLLLISCVAFGIHVN